MRQVHDQRDDGGNQQKMNQESGRVHHTKTQDPKEQQDDE
jgi:hypothetical protein